MKIACASILRRPRFTRAMTLLEVMIAATLMSVIIYALYTMFDRVQRVLRAGTAQVDVMEAGRVAAELIERDLELLHIGGGPEEKGLFLTNAFVDVDYRTNFPANYQDAWTVPMALADGTRFAGELHSLFFVTRPDAWKAIGYRVAHPTNVTMAPPNGVGTLYRFERTYVTSKFLSISNNSSASGANGLYLTNNPFHRFFSVANRFLPDSNATYQALGDGSILNDFSRVMDGVVNFQCRIIQYDPTRSDGYDYLSTNVTFQTNATDRSRLPVQVEVDIGLLEPKVLENIRALVPGSAVATNILGRQVGKIHTFALRIPVRLKP